MHKSYIIQSILCFLLVLAILLVLSYASSHTVQIQSSDQQFFCPGDKVTLICETRGSLTIAWRSSEYVTYPLEFAEYESIGTTLNDVNHHDTLANFTDKRIENGVLVMESQLHVKIGPNASSPSVACVHANGTMDIIKFHVLVNPDMGDIESDQRRSVSGGCWVLISWSLPSGFSVDEISHFIVSLNGTQLANETLGTKSLAMRTYPVHICGVQTINIVGVNLCGNTGRSTTFFVMNPMEEMTTLANTTDSPVLTCSDNKDVLIAVVVSFVVFGLVVFLSYVIIIICYCCLRKRGWMSPESTDENTVEMDHVNQLNSDTDAEH